jgi:hypothetical protein
MNIFKKFIFPICLFIRNIIPDNLYYSRLFVPLRLIYGKKVKNKKREHLRFDVHLADHCNLNCKGCEHFSPLSPQKFIDIKKYEHDCKRLADLTGGNIGDIALLGGEPLLHPNICDIIRITRSHFTNGLVRIITNGTLLLKQSDDFYDCCRINDITIVITIYPVRLDYEAIMNMAEKHGVKMQFWGDVKNASNSRRKLPIDYVGKSWRKLSIDIKGKQNPERSNALCYASNYCFQLVEGKLYKCWRIAYIKYFNDFFDKSLKITESDYIDIYKENDIDIILEKLHRPARFCRYCIMDSASVIKWANSEKNITEWT